MSKYLSFGLLIVVILLLCIIFYQVMAAFLLPLFLATVLVVVFRPVHQWVLGKCGKRKSLACGLTTGIICLSVLVPIGTVGLIAFGEARHMLRDLTSGGLEQNLKRIRRSLNLEMPAVEAFQKLDRAIRGLDLRNWGEIRAGADQLARVQLAAREFDVAFAEHQRLAESPIERTPEFEKIGKECGDALRIAVRQNELVAKIREEARNPRPDPPNASPNQSDAKKNPDTNSGNSSDSKTAESKAVLESRQEEVEKSYREALEQLLDSHQKFKTVLLGGPISIYLKELANPTEKEFERYNNEMIGWIKKHFLSLSGQATQFVFSLLFNGAIMIVAVYFFLYDGAGMIATLKFLSPLDDRHEQELIDEFDKVSRAVVVATLAAAISQGILAGIGYYFAGVEAVFLLTMLTAVLALVPFIGAAAIWVPTCIYLYLIEEQLVPAIMLGIWGAAVVSTVDNLVKPLILHGQSNIHPLLALLSVLGGVAALGPIGILVGPMVVAFLQTLLRILQRELNELDFQQPTEEESDAKDDSPKVDDFDPNATVVDDGRKSVSGNPSSGNDESGKIGPDKPDQ